MTSKLAFQTSLWMSFKNVGMLLSICGQVISNEVVALLSSQITDGQRKFPVIFSHCVSIYCIDQTWKSRTGLRLEIRLILQGSIGSNMTRRSLSRCHHSMQLNWAAVRSSLVELLKTGQRSVGLLSLWRWTWSSRALRRRILWLWWELIWVLAMLLVQSLLPKMACTMWSTFINLEKKSLCQNLRIG